MMVIDNKYEIGEIVYLKTDLDQIARVVVAITVRPENCIVYSLACGIDSSLHYALEISHEADAALKVT
jgi:hypothetical protein